MSEGPAREILASFGIDVDTEKLESGSKKIDDFVGKLKSVGEAVLAAFAIKEVKEFAFGLAEQAEKLELQAISLGTSVEALQQWQYAANMVGVGADQLTGAMMRLERAAAGGKGGGQGLAKLGIVAKDAHGEMKPVTQLMDEVAEKIAGIEDPAKRTQIMMGIFGRQGAKLIPLFEGGKEGIKKYREEVAKLGGGITKDFVEKSKEMLQNQKRLNFALLSAKVNVAGAMIPSITAAIGKLVQFVMWIHNTIDVVTAFKAAAVLLVGAGLAKLITSLGGLNIRLAATLFQMALLAAAFLLIDDAMHFFAGDESLIGNWLDKQFGPGSADKVRAWFSDYEQLSKDSTDSTKTFGQQFLATGALMAGVFASGMKDMESFKRVMSASLDGIRLALQIMVLEIGHFWAGIGARIQNFFGGIFNGIVEGYARLGEVLGDSKETSASIRAHKTGDAVAENDAYYNQVKAQLVTEADEIAARLDPQYQMKKDAAKEANDQVTGYGQRFAFTEDANGNATAGTAESQWQRDNRMGANTSGQFVRAPAPEPYGPPNEIHAPITINVTVPPGTPQDQAAAVAKASADATSGALRDTKAIIPGGGKR